MNPPNQIPLSDRQCLIILNALNARANALMQLWIESEFIKVQEQIESQLIDLSYASAPFSSSQVQVDIALSIVNKRIYDCVDCKHHTVISKWGERFKIHIL